MVIWKFPLHPGTQTIEMRVGARLLDVQVQFDQPQLWALVDENTELRESRTIVIYGTGWAIQNDPGRYVATFQDAGGSLVWHVFDVTPLAKATS